MTKTLSVRSRIILNTKVQAALATAKTAQAQYEQTLSSLEKLLNPDHYTHAAKIALDRATTPQAIEAAMKEIEALSGPGSAPARARAQALALNALSEFEKALPPLIEAATEAIELLKIEAVESEKVLFELYALPYEPTAVSKRIHDAESTVLGFRDSLKPQSLGSRTVAPGAYSNVISFFE